MDTLTETAIGDANQAGTMQPPKSLTVAEMVGGYLEVVEPGRRVRSSLQSTDAHPTRGPVRPETSTPRCERRPRTRRAKDPDPGQSPDP
jgi:hypothetical protein